MPVAGSTYWNHGARSCSGEEACQDEEGMQTMRNLARNHGVDDEMFCSRKSSRSGTATDGAGL